MIFIFKFIFLNFCTFNLLLIYLRLLNFKFYSNKLTKRFVFLPTITNLVLRNLFQEKKYKHTNEKQLCKYIIFLQLKI
jgi:hypothetical protein